MEIVSYSVYDLKYIGERDINYNPSLGTGQIQIRDIHYVELEERATWDFCRLLDTKHLNSSQKSFHDWLRLASKHEWIKQDD